jgi:hypothetical protein
MPPMITITGLLTQDNIHIVCMQADYETEVIERAIIDIIFIDHVMRMIMTVIVVVTFKFVMAVVISGMFIAPVMPVLMMIFPEIFMPGIVVSVVVLCRTYTISIVFIAVFTGSCH